MSNKDACNCHQAKALQSELADLRAAAYQVLAWIDRSHTVSREAAERLERALAVGAREAEPEVVATPDVLRSLSPEEFEKLKGISEEELREELEAGRRDVGDIHAFRMRAPR